jgi:tetratricopeptide (TPR) repeat protein
LLGAPLDEVERWMQGAEDISAYPWAGAWSPDTAATVEVAADLWRWDVDPSRRRVLASLPWVPAVLSDWLLAWSLDPGAPSRAHAGPGKRVGTEDVHRVHDAIEAFVRMDHQYGGGLVRPAVVDYLNSHVAALLRGRYTDEVGAALMTAAAAMTALAGWEAYDLLQHGLAQVHYGQALRLAKQADDPLTAAWVLTMLSQQAIDRAEPVWAVRLARAGAHAGDQADATPRVRAGLLLREARATAVGVQLAETLDAHAARRVQLLLAEVDREMARVCDGDDDPVWVMDLGPAEVAAEAGCTWHMIGQHARAVDCAQRALTGFGSAFPRSRQFNLVHRAQALTDMGDLDAALASARSAVPAANGLTSLRSAQLIKTFDNALPSGERRVRDWREYLRTELRRAA